MVGWLFKKIWLGVITALILAGCQQQGKDVLDYGPDVKTLAIPTDYASGALEATGGLELWMATKRLELDCVVTLFRPDGSFYLTEHHYEVFPWSNSIRISTQEPLSKFTWQLSAGQFSMLEGNEQVDVSPIAGSYRDFAEAILYITTAPVRFLDSELEFTRSSTPVKMEGLWYYPIEAVTRASNARGEAGAAEPYWSKVVFYQNRDNSLIDILWLVDIDEGKILMVRGFDYSEQEKKGVKVASKIEIFRTDMRGALQKRIAQIDLK